MPFEIKRRKQKYKYNTGITVEEYRRVNETMKIERDKEENIETQKRTLRHRREHRNKEKNLETKKRTQIQRKDNGKG